MDFDISTPTGARTVRISLPSLPYGVLVSGGFDSSLLLALVLMTRAQENHRVPMTAYNVRRGYGTEAFAEEIVRRLGLHFGVTIHLEHLPLPPETPHQESVMNPTVRLLDAGRIIKAFVADTTNPPIETPGSLQPVRLPVCDQFKYRRWALPFLHLDKSHTVGLVRQLGLTFIETHSHTCTRKEAFRCGQCFQCMERAWAYQTLGLTDPGEH